MTGRLAAAVGLAGVALAACGGGDSPAGSSAGGAQAGGGDSVAIKNFTFNPDHLTVKVGSTVHFTNNDGSTHTATGDAKEFDTGDLTTGKAGTFAPTKAGTITYHCSIHNYMHGTLTVTP